VISQYPALSLEDTYINYNRKPSVSESDSPMMHDVGSLIRLKSQEGLKIRHAGRDLLAGFTRSLHSCNHDAPIRSLTGGDHYRSFDQTTMQCDEVIT
jgi:hypothetical protein